MLILARPPQLSEDQRTRKDPPEVRPATKPPRPHGHWERGLRQRERRQALSLFSAHPQTL